MTAAWRGRLALAMGISLAAACSREPPPAIEQLRAAVADFAAGKTEPSEAQIDALFAQVDADAAVLRAEAAAAKQTSDAGERAAALESERVTLWQSYVKAKVERLRGAAENTVRAFGKQVGQNLEEAGRRIQESMEQR